MNRYQLIHNNEFLNFEVYIHLIKRLISSTVSNIFLHVPLAKVVEGSINHIERMKGGCRE
ncbi:hypothetical protein PMEGAPL128_56270 [Priestia megaterium]